MFKASKGNRAVRFSGKVAAIEFALRENADQVTDTDTGEIVWRNGETPEGIKACAPRNEMLVNLFTKSN